MTQRTEIEPLKQVRSGDKDAFGELVEPHYNQALRLAVRIVSNQETAEDLVQESVLAAWLSLSSLREEAAFGSWLYGITLNLCHSQLRDRRADPLSLDSLLGGRLSDDEVLADPAPTPDETAEAHELQQLVRMALRDLSPQIRRAATLFYLESLSLRETAALMDVSVGTVKAQLHKARQLLRKAMLVAFEDDHLTEERSPDMAEVSIWDVIESSDDSYVVVLLDENTNRFLPVTIGDPEGRALVMGIRDIAFPRPLTHVLMANMLVALGADLKEVRIERLTDTTFYAVMALNQEGALRELDCRPSDAMCLAVQSQAPIYVADDILDKVGKKEGDILKIEKNGETLEIDGKNLDAVAARIKDKLSSSL